MSSGDTGAGPLVAVLGTGTEVGKTWVTARLVEHLRERGERVEVRKPLQSFDPDETGPTDAEVLARASGEPVELVCAPGGSFEVAMAPPMAAAVLGTTVPDTAELLAALVWHSEGVRLVETVGGVRSPMSADADSAGVAEALGADRTLLVADAGLGVIDSVRSALANLPPGPLVFLNRFERDDPLHEANRRWLADVDGIDALVGIDELAERIRHGWGKPHP